MWLRAIIFVGLCALLNACGALARSATGNRVLAVLGGDSAAYTQWLETLREHGYALTVRDVSGGEPIRAYGEYRYDHVIIMAPESKTFPAHASPQQLVDFLKDGGNVLVGLSSELTEVWRDFAREFGLEFGLRESKLVDHFRVDRSRDAGDDSAIYVGGRSAPFEGGGPVTGTPVFSRDTLALAAGSPFVYDGVAHWVGPNPLAFSLIAPSATAYQTDVPVIERSGGAWHAKGLSTLEPLYESKSLLTGFDADSHSAVASLASAVQLRGSNGRATFVGSTALFQNTLYGAAPLQRAIVDDLTAWTFQERGVLDVVDTAHERVRKDELDVRPEYEEEPGVAKMYRIKDDLAFSIDLSAWHGDGYVPAPEDLDLQVSIWMLDPFVTVPLAPIAASNGTAKFTRYGATFRLPDRHGVFTMRVDWKRYGWSYIVTDDTAPVRPFNHDEYPRMLSSSWPYIAGALSTMLAFVVFGTVWLLLPPEKVASKKM